MTSEFTQQELAVLGLLFEHHHYAYRIKEIMEKRAMDGWVDIDYSTIPTTIEKLEEEGLVDRKIHEIDVESKNKEENVKEVYSITDKGRTVFLGEIKSILSKKDKIFYPFNLGLANIMFLSDDEITESLESYLKSLEEQINYLEYSTKIQAENNIPNNFISISKRSIYLLKAEKNWIKEFMKEFTQ